VNHNRGFSLVELAIVLMIVGLLISSAITVGGVQLSKSRMQATKERQAAIKSAFVSYILRNNRLPCPAVPTLSESDAGYGYEAATPGTCTSVPSGSGVSVGVLPWKSLGLTSDGADDGYHNRYTYAVTTSQTNLSATTISGLRGSMTIHSATPVATANQINNCPPSGWTYNPCAAVVVIISHGELGSGAYTKLGTRIDLPDADNADELENTNIDSAFIDKEFSSVQDNSYNDLIMALDADDLLLPLVTSGAIKDYQAKIETDFRVITGMVATEGLASRTGVLPGARTYPIAANMGALGLPTANTVDPWGSSYLYARVTNNINSSTGNNIAFTITSYGPDNISGTGDDIVETVMVSDMQSLFSTYGW
jgi:prepilin-type N-terminal cleavage/methylation domain-containing protein